MRTGRTSEKFPYQFVTGIVQAIREGSIDEAYKETYRGIYAKAYQEGLEEGFAIVVTQILQNNYSVSQVAELLEVSIEKVEQVNQNLKEQ